MYANTRTYIYLFLCFFLIKKEKGCNKHPLSLSNFKNKDFSSYTRESLISFPPIMKNTQHLSSSQTSDNITPNNPECSFEKPFY